MEQDKMSCHNTYYFKTFLPMLFFISFAGMVTGSSSTSSSISNRLDRLSANETQSPDPQQHHQPQSNLSTLAQAAHKHSMQAQQDAAAVVAAGKNYTPLPRGEAPTCRESYFADTQNTAASSGPADKGNSKPLEGLAASLQARVIASLKIKEEHEQRFVVFSVVS